MVEEGLPTTGFLSHTMFTYSPSRVFWCFCVFSALSSVSFGPWPSWQVKSGDNAQERTEMAEKARFGCTRRSRA